MAKLTVKQQFVMAMIRKEARVPETYMLLAIQLQLM